MCVYVCDVCAYVYVRECVCMYVCRYSACVVGRRPCCFKQQDIIAPQSPHRLDAVCRPDYSEGPALTICAQSHTLLIENG